MSRQLEIRAEELADQVEHHTLSSTPLTRRDLVLAAAELHARHGAARTVTLLHNALIERREHHATIIVFVVWAVDRLAASGASITRMCWHPLTCAGAELAWWDPATLASDESRERFVAPTLALPGDPVPTLPRDPALASAG